MSCRYTIAVEGDHGRRHWLHGRADKAQKGPRLLVRGGSTEKPARADWN